MLNDQYWQLHLVQITLLTGLDQRLPLRALQAI